MPQNTLNVARPAPLDRGLNVAILHIAGRLFPTGFDVSDNAPSTYEELAAHVLRTRRMVVWSGNSDRTIYADAEVNYAFRAWHDWCHLVGGYDFTLEGERKAAFMQMAHLTSLYGVGEEVMQWCRIIQAEVMGQARHFHETGAFPEDQVAFVRNYLAEMGR